MPRRRNALTKADSDKSKDKAKKASLPPPIPIPYGMEDCEGYEEIVKSYRNAFEQYDHYINQEVSQEQKKEIAKTVESYEAQRKSFIEKHTNPYCDADLDALDDHESLYGHLIHKQGDSVGLMPEAGESVPGTANEGPLYINVHVDRSITRAHNKEVETSKHIEPDYVNIKIPKDNNIDEDLYGVFEGGKATSKSFNKYQNDRSKKLN